MWLRQCTVEHKLTVFGNGASVRDLCRCAAMHGHIGAMDIYDEPIHIRLANIHFQLNPDTLVLVCRLH